MKYLFFLFLPFLMICVPAQGQMIEVAPGEYAIFHVKSDGTVWVPYSVVYDTTYVVTQVAGLSGIVEADGGQYNCVFRKSDGTVYSARGGAITSTAYPLDSTGAAFTCDKVYGMWRNMVAIKNGEVYYWSADNAMNEDMLLQFNATIAANIPAPRKLIQPIGKTIVKCVHGSTISPYGTAKLWGIASDGTLWQWDQTHTTPFQVTGKSGKPGTWSGVVVDAALMGTSAQLVITSTDQVWVWGYGSSAVGGHDDWQDAPMDNITPNLTSAGVVFPLKQIVANYISIHLIDANNNHFAIGNNQCGAIGDGFMTPSWATHYNGTSNSVYGFDWLMNHYPQTSWVQIPGKWKNLRSNTSVVFYWYGQDMGDNWYSWGRAKAQVLGNGRAWKTADQAAYPDWLDVPVPRSVTPLTQTWTVEGPVNPSMLRAPIVTAGINQYLPNGTPSTTLSSVTHQQQPTNGVTSITMASYLWTKVSGPSGSSLATPTSSNTVVTGLVTGTHVFQLVVTSSIGAQDTAQVAVVVSPMLTISGPPYGQSTPAYGIYTNYLSTNFTMKVTNSPVYVGGTTQYACRGWTGSGSVPVSGAGTNTGPLMLTNDSILAWCWATNYWLATTTTNGTVDVTNGWREAGSNVTLTAAPDLYYHFESWAGDVPSIRTNDNPLLLLMDRPRLASVGFAANMATNNTPHWWLAQFGLSTNNIGALSNLDDDGALAWQEHAAGTDPTNMQSVLKITGMAVNGSTAIISWKGGNTVTQCLEMLQTLTSGQWTAIFTNIPPTPTTTNYTDSTVDSTRFYRVEVR